jgi:hypothetical protein
MGAGDPGTEFQEDQHPYAADLDLFGEGSLFERMAETRTRIGAETLAEWMKRPAEREEVLARQCAVEELRGRLDLREALQLAGRQTVSGCDPRVFSEWLSAPAARLSAAIPPIAGALAALWIGLLVAGLLKAIPPLAACGWIAAALAAETAFSWRMSRQVSAVIDEIGMPSVELGTVAALVRLLAASDFKSPKLAALAGTLREGDAIRHLGGLERQIRLLEWRRYDMFTVFSWAILWGTQFAVIIERWRQTHGRAMLTWIEAIGEFEALAAMAGYAYERPDDPFPELVESGALFEAEALGHPLLGPACHTNDVSLGAAGARFLLVSGSNMSGKSTFLRTVGINAVLASMGAPVCARRLRISAVEVLASIRIQDSLLRGRSHFYAEVSRLREMLERAAAGPVLFLIDEILSGTNSHDRRIAAEAVIASLAGRGAVGIVTTHDLAVTAIADAPGLGGANAHLCDAGEEGGLDFDYRLRPGVLQRSNALTLVRSLGISV